MYLPLLKDTGSQIVPIYLVDETDYQTPETGVTSPDIILAKGDGTVATPSDGVWAEADATNFPGLYYVSLNATDTDTDGLLLLRVSASGCALNITSCAVRGNLEVRTGISAIDNHTVTEALTALLAFAKGKIIKDGDDLTYYEQDNATPLFTLTLAANGRTRT